MVQNEIKWKATQIQWDTDGDEDVLETLPTEIDIPADVLEEAENPEDEEEVSELASDYISDETGFCHYGFVLERV